MSNDASISSADFDGDTVGDRSVADMDSKAPTEPLGQEPQITRIYYYIDKEPSPYSTTVQKPLSQLTLSDFKATLTKTTYKYFNKVEEPDGQDVKMEVKDDNEILLPSSNGFVTIYCVTDEQMTPLAITKPVPVRESMTHVPPHARRNSRLQPFNNLPRRRAGSFRQLHPRNIYEDTDFEISDARAYSDDEFSSITDFTSVSQQRQTRISRHKRKHNRHQYHHRMSPSFYETTFSDASMFCEVISIPFDLTNKKNKLGISISEDGKCIYVANVEPGSLADMDGRVRPGMMILSINDHDLSYYPPSEAVNYLLDTIKRSPRITMEFARDERHESHEQTFAPKKEPVMPIDTKTWVKQTMLMNNQLHPAQMERRSPNHLNLVYNPICLNTGGFPSSGVGTSICSENSYTFGNMTQHYQMQPKRFQLRDKLTIATAMASPGGLEQKHMVSKRKTFISTEMVDWLRKNVEGLAEKDACMKFADTLVRDGLIKAVINEKNFLVKADMHYEYTDKLKNLVKHHRPLTTLNKPAMDDTVSVPQKGLAYKIKRFFCVQPRQSSSAHLQHQFQQQQQKYPSAVRQLFADENIVPPISHPPMSRLSQPRYLRGDNIRSTHIP